MKTDQLGYHLCNAVHYEGLRYQLSENLLSELSQAQVLLYSEVYYQLKTGLYWSLNDSLDNGMIEHLVRAETDHEDP